VQTEILKSTVYFDGSCPLCRAEVTHYRSINHAGALSFVDVSETVAAYRAALEEMTRERVPLQWAMTQNNLGNARAMLGQRESGTARLEEAVAAFHAALKERTRERVPLDWAATQNNLGNVLRELGERESGTAWLEEAVAAFHAALKERTRERVPLDWAATQNSLGNALAALGQRENRTVRLEEAVAAYRAALEEMTRERVRRTPTISATPARPILLSPKSRREPQIKIFSLQGKDRDRGLAPPMGSKQARPTAYGPRDRRP